MNTTESKIAVWKIAVLVAGTAIGSMLMILFNANPNF